MAGGYAPVGAVLVREAILDVLRRSGGFVHGFTFSHNAVTAAACLATLDVLERERLVERAAVLGDRALGRLKSLESHPCVGDVRGRGLLLGIELVEDRPARRPFPRSRALAEDVARRAFGEGLVTYYGTGVTGGNNGDAILFAPPFVVTEAQIDASVAILDRVLTELGL
jgi:adenosylmethionine-8-amino-7-oxononanoate aminotransferase